MSTNNQYHLLVSGSAPELWPTETFFAILWVNDSYALEIPKRYPFSGKWGEILSTQLLLDDDYPMPIKLDMVWLSIVEQRFYSIEAALPTLKMEEYWQQTDPNTSESLFSHIVIGMAPYGQAAVWLRGHKKSTLISWLTGEETKVTMRQFMPSNPKVTLDEYCKYYINNDARVKENLVANGLPDEELFNQLMAQYCYRVVPLFEVWDEDKEQWKKHEPDDSDIPMFDYVEMSCTDGTFDKLHDDYLISHHTSGTPERMNLFWHVKKSDWMMYVWFDAQVLSPMLKRFYGAHRDTRVDLLVHCDPERRHYEVALFRYGMQQPHLLPEECYQVIVFKNQFEHYRSANYAQPGGAWVW